MLALSVRQPWAWAIVAGLKPVENRSRNIASRFSARIGETIAIHAAWSMSDDDYTAAAAFMARLGVSPPAPDDLWYGGVIGTARVSGVVTAHKSPWFSGPVGIVLSDARSVEFVECRGWPGAFDLAQSGVAAADLAGQAARSGMVARAL